MADRASGTGRARSLRERSDARDDPKPRVLVVDDEPDDVLVARRALGERFEVEALGTAARALERLQAAPALDLVVLDYRLGDMNALTFLRAARSGEGGRPPVIVVSGRDDPRVAAAARELGAFAFVPKDAFARGALAGDGASRARDPRRSARRPGRGRGSVPGGERAVHPTSSSA